MSCGKGSPGLGRPKGLESPAPGCLFRCEIPLVRLGTAPDDETRRKVCRSIQDRIDEAVIFLDSGGKLLFQNRMAARLLEAGLLRSGRNGVIHCGPWYLPDKVTRFSRCPLARAVHGERFSGVEAFVAAPKKAPGSWLSVSAKPFLDSTKRFMGSVIVVRDITGHKSAQEALRASESYYRSLIENASDVIAVVDSSAAVRYASPSVRRVLGWKPQELTGKNPYRFIHPDDRRRTGLPFWHNLRRSSNGVRLAELRLRNKDGSWRLLECVGRMLPDHDAVVICGRDVTERKRADELILFQASLLDQVRNAVIALDTSGKVLYWNNYAETVFRWKREEAIGRQFSGLVVPSGSRKECLEALNRIPNRAACEAEMPLVRRDGEIFPGFISASVVKSPSGRRIGTVVVAIDASARKRSEEALRLSREQLRLLAKRLHSAREEERIKISRDLHDELGQRLTALNFEISRIQKGLTRIPEAHALLEEANRIAGMISDMLDAVQMMSAELRPRILDDLGLAAAIEWEAHEARKRTGVRYVINDKLNRVRLRGDVRTTVFRIFQEILTNIVRHAHASEVGIDLVQRNGHLVLRVKDDGRGITKAEISDPWALGLLGMRERAAAIGGEIRFRGAPVNGTMVTLKVPLGNSNTHSRAYIN